MDTYREQLAAELKARTWVVRVRRTEGGRVGTCDVITNPNGGRWDLPCLFDEAGAKDMAARMNTMPCHQDHPASPTYQPMPMDDYLDQLGTRVEVATGWDAHCIRETLQGLPNVIDADHVTRHALVRLLMETLGTAPEAVKPETVADIVAEMLAYEADQFNGAPDTDLNVSGADLVDAFTQWRQRLIAATLADVRKA